MSRNQWCEVVTEHVRISGRLEIEVESMGLVVARLEQKNDITDDGMNLIRDMLLGQYGQDPGSIAAGTDDGTLLAVAATNTALGAESIRKIINRRTSSNKVAKWQMVLLTSEGNGVTYQEAGLFKDTVQGSANDKLYARATHADVAKTSAIALTYTWNWTLTGT